MKTTVMQYTARGEGNELVTLVELEGGESHDEAFNKLKTWSDSKVSKKANSVPNDSAIATNDLEKVGTIPENTQVVELRLSPEDIKSFVDSVAEFRNTINNNKKEEVPVNSEGVNDGVQG